MALSTRSRIVKLRDSDNASCQKWLMPEFGNSSGAPVESPGVTQPQSDESVQKSDTQAAIDAGFEAGYNDGVKAAKTQFSEQQQLMSSLLSTLHNTVQGLGDVVTRELMLLAVDIARAIIRVEIDVSPEILGRMISEAVASLPAGPEPVTIKVHPEDLKTLSELSLFVPDEQVIHWVEDTHGVRGEFIVARSDSSVHTGIEALLQQAVTQLDLVTDEHNRIT